MGYDTGFPKTLVRASLMVSIRRSHEGSHVADHQEFVRSLSIGLERQG